jgi:hypothetical protein
MIYSLIYLFVSPFSIPTIPLLIADNTFFSQSFVAIVIYLTCAYFFICLQSAEKMDIFRNKKENENKFQMLLTPTKPRRWLRSVEKLCVVEKAGKCKLIKIYDKKYVNKEATSAFLPTDLTLYYFFYQNCNILSYLMTIKNKTSLLWVISHVEDEIWGICWIYSRQRRCFVKSFSFIISPLESKCRVWGGTFSSYHSKSHMWGAKQFVPF